MHPKRWLGFVLTLILVWPLLAAEEKPANKDKPDGKGKETKTEKSDPKEQPPEKPEPREEKPAPKERTVSAGKLLCKMVQPPDGETMKVSVLIGRDRWEATEVKVAEEFKVRWLQPPTMFDDKGRPKTLTRQELIELKGPDRRIPGYTAELTDLRNGQVIEIHLVKKPGRPRNLKDKEEVEKYLPRVNLILIVGEPRH